MKKSQREDDFSKKKKKTRENMRQFLYWVGKWRMEMLILQKRQNFNFPLQPILPSKHAKYVLRKQRKKRSSEESD